MRLIRAILAISFALSLMPNGRAEDLPNMHGVFGKCLIAHVGREPMRCKSALVIMTQNGRTVYFAELYRTKGTAVLTFSGGRDSQPTLDQYTLFVDKIGLGLNGGKIETIPAKGTCESSVSDDGKFSRSQHCKATSGDGVIFELQVGPGPVK